MWEGEGERERERTGVNGRMYVAAIAVFDIKVRVWVLDNAK